MLVVREFSSFDLAAKIQVGASQASICIWVISGDRSNAGSDTVGLGEAHRVCVSNKPLGEQMLLFALGKARVQVVC